MRLPRSQRAQDALVIVVAIAGVAVYVAAASRLHEMGFPLDDSWIHQTYARNLAERGEWAFVPGEPSVASTSPLYTVLLAGGYALGVPFYAWTFALGALALAAGGLVASRVAPILFPDVPFVGPATGVLTVLAWHLVWAAASGMETMLFAALALLVIALAWRERAPAALPQTPAACFRRGGVFGLAGAALTLARPEGLMLVGLAGAFVVAAWPGPWAERWRAWLAWGVGAVAGWLVGVAPYVWLNYDLSGKLLPNTASAKQAENAPALDLPLLERYWLLIRPLVAGGQILLLPGMIVAWVTLVRRALAERGALLYWLPAAWAVAHWSAYVLRLPAPYQHGRYMIPIVPVLLLYGVGGTLALAQRARRSLAGRVLTRSLALAAAVVMAAFWAIGARAYAQDVRIINTEMVATARWIEATLPPEALLAVHDIGAVGYYAPRPLLDLAGLVSPEVVPIIRDPEALMQLMCRREARYLMVLPNQRPAPEDDPRLGGAPIFETGAPYAPAIGEGNMAVYRLDWSAGCG